MDRSWLVQKSKNVENFGNFGHISKNIQKIELLVFFRPVGPQDAMFEKKKFKILPVNQKFAVKKSERRIAYDWSIITGPDSGVVRRFPTVQVALCAG